MVYEIIMVNWSFQKSLIALFRKRKINWQKIRYIYWSVSDNFSQNSNVMWNYNEVKPKKVVLFPEIDRIKIFISLTQPHSRMCIRIYLFNFKKSKQTSKQKTNKKTKKAKECKEKKRMYVKNLTAYDDIVCEFALRTFNLLNHLVIFSWLFIWIQGNLCATREMTVITVTVALQRMWSTHFQQQK